MRGSKSILLTTVRGSFGIRSIILDGARTAIRILWMPAIITVVARLGIRKKRWRMRMVKKDVETTGSVGSELLK